MHGQRDGQREEAHFEGGKVNDDDEDDYGAVDQDGGARDRRVDSINEDQVSAT